MKPETPAKAPAISKPEEYLALGIPEEWVEPLQKLGYTTIDKLKEVENSGKLVSIIRLELFCHLVAHIQIMALGLKKKTDLRKLTTNLLNSF